MSYKKVLDEIGERISGNEETKKGFVLLYKTTDTANVEEFHRKCDAKGPTVTLLYGLHNTLFGGYTSKNWSSPINKQKVKDEKAFLFAKDDNVDAKCIFLPIKKDKTENAIMCAPKYGPTFGAKSFGGYDLLTFKRGKKSESDYKDDSLHLNGSININNAYSVERKARNKDEHDAGDADQPKLKTKDINSGRMIVKRLEVYQVTDDEYEEMWYEKLEEQDFQKTKQKLIEMEPLPGLDIDRYNILLLGAIGAGKSSFINTISTVFSHKVVQIAPARQAATSVTSKVTAYNIKTENGERTKICLYDVRGFENDRGYGKELDLLLKGTLSMDFQFTDEVEELRIEEDTNPTSNNKIHFVCMVEGNSDFDKYSPEIRKHITDTQERISKKGLPQAVVATKLDLICTNIAKDVDHLFKSPKAKEAVKRISDFYGVPLNHVFPVVNYIDEKEPLQTKDQLALLAIREICKLTEGYLTYHDDLQDIPDGWKDREKILPKLKKEADKKVLLGIVNDGLLELGNKKLRVLVVGSVGSGKSSFIDSLASALRNVIIMEAVGSGMACANVDSATSTTEKFQQYCMKYVYEGTETRKSNVLLGDTPGFQEDKGIKVDHVKFIINGNVPDKYKIINGIQETQEDFKKEPTPGDKMHCVCLVFDCENIENGLSDSMKATMNDLLRLATTQACPQMVVLTKCDKVSRVMSAGRIRVFEDAKVRNCKNILMKTFRLKQQHIFPVVNYVDDNVIDLQKDALLLAAFFNILKIGKERLEVMEEEAGQQN